MKSRNLLYIGISIICVISIAIAVYYQIFIAGKEDIQNPNTNTSNIGQVEDKIDLDKIKNNFNSLFTNTINMQGYEIDEQYKYNKDKDIIYAAYSVKEEKEDSYNVNLNLPIFNIDNQVTKEFNNTTQNIFVNKANEIFKSTKGYTVYNVDYAAYVNENILSLVIKSTLKEGASAQRTIIQTYNYNIETEEEVKLVDLLDKRQISKEDVNKKIERYVSYANSKVDAISGVTSQTVYKRDLNNAIYVVDNINNFFIGENGRIYIVYAYGNSNFTSEMDIITID